MSKICRNCIYWAYLTESERAANANKVIEILPGVGICRRYPAAILKSGEDFCGEFDSGIK